MTQIRYHHTLLLRFANHVVAFALLALLGGCSDPGNTELATEEESTGEVSQALHCPGSDYVSVSDGSASASLWLHYNCSGGRARITGTLYDINCDNRSAFLELNFYHDSVWPSLIYRTDVLQNGKGCSTSIAIDRNTGDNTPAVRVYVYAANRNPGQSSGASGWLIGG